MTRVALYTRVSTEDQAKEGFSLDAQLERLRFYAKAQGWTVAGEFVDEGQSGRTTKRTAYQDMLVAIDTWDTILVLKMDRIHRNSRNFMQMMDTLRKQGKQFASVTESLDTSTAMGRFVMDIIQRIAQLESDQIGERTHMGMGEKHKQRGGNLGKRAPFGYAYGPGQVLQPVPAEAPAALELFQRFAGGAGKVELAAWLNKQGFRGRGGRGKPGAPFNHKTVHNLLANVTFAGDTDWDGTIQPDTHPAIVPRLLFEAVQARLGRAAGAPPVVSPPAAPVSA